MLCLADSNLPEARLYLQHLFQMNCIYIYMVPINMYYIYIYITIYIYNSV